MSSAPEKFSSTSVAIYRTETFTIPQVFANIMLKFENTAKKQKPLDFCLKLYYKFNTLIDIPDSEIIV